VSGMQYGGALRCTVTNQSHLFLLSTPTGTLPTNLAPPHPPPRPPHTPPPCRETPPQTLSHPPPSPATHALLCRTPPPEQSCIAGQAPLGVEAHAIKLGIVGATRHKGPAAHAPGCLSAVAQLGGQLAGGTVSTHQHTALHLGTCAGGTTQQQRGGGWSAERRGVGQVSRSQTFLAAGGGTCWCSQTHVSCCNVPTCQAVLLLPHTLKINAGRRVHCDPPLLYVL
jgi:hypothetical protein